MSDEQAEPVTETVVTDTAGTEAAPQDKISASMEAAYESVQDKHRPLPNESSFPHNHEAAANEPENETENGTDEVEQVSQPGDVKPPPSLNAKARQHWPSLPKDVQQFIAERERQAERRIGELGREASVAREVGQVFEKYRSLIPERLPDGREATPHAVVETLLAAGHALQTDPENAIRFLARQHGVDLGTFTSGQVDAQAIRQQAYAEFQAELQQQHAQQQTTYIEKFAADKPYFSHIQNEVLYHVLALKGTNPELDYRELLRRAHDKALAEHPDLDPKTKERTQTQMREAKRKADEARRQQSLNVRSTVGAAPRSSGDMYSRMADIYDQIHGRH